MKKILSILALFFVMSIVAPTANAGSSPNVLGVIYQNTITPGDGFNMVAPTKSGSASCKSIFALVSVGNCSIREAMKNGGISQLSHYDVQRENVLGIQTITIKAYGR